MTVQGIDQIAYQRLDLVIPVGQGGRLEGVVERTSVDEETVLTENLFENVSLHFLSPRAYHVSSLLSYSGRVGVGQRGF